jgi:hypothetical protein
MKREYKLEGYRVVNDGPSYEWIETFDREVDMVEFLGRRGDLDLIVVNGEHTTARNYRDRYAAQAKFAAAHHGNA